MATPRLGLVVEDKPTELSCTTAFVHVNNSDSVYTGSGSVPSTIQMQRDYLITKRHA